jgi:predicted XRE-type DNA-binding protein
MKTGKSRLTKAKTKAEASELVVEASSGNVFADLGLSNPEERLAKAQLTVAICDLIAKRKLTQADAASILKIDQPKISNLMRGKLSGFSTDRLIRFLNALGSDVEIVIRPQRTKKAGSLRIVPAAKAG